MNSRWDVIRRSAIMGLIVVGTSILALGCGAATSRVETAAEVRPDLEDAFWSRIRVSGDDAFQFDTLKSQASGSDGVFLGSFTDIRLGRIVPEPGGSSLQFVIARFSIIEVMGRGPSPGASIDVEFPLSSAGDSVASSGLADAKAALPSTSVLMFAIRQTTVAKLIAERGGRSVYPADPDIWLPITSRAIWVQGAEGPITTDDGSTAIEIDPSLSTTLRSLQELGKHVTS